MKKLLVTAAALFVLSTSLQAKEWYEEKGTLHQVTMKEWCKADAKNKLATAGDLVAAGYQNQMFKPELMQAIEQYKMEGIKVMANELVTALNGSCEGKKAIEGVSTTTVGDMSIMAMMLMGWQNVKQ